MTLVELMIAMLILAIVCVAWLEIIGIQSARREARRREAVERLAGMMDAFMYLSKTDKGVGKIDLVKNGKKRTQTISAGTYYKFGQEGNKLYVYSETKNALVSLDDSLDPIRYQLHVESNDNNKYGYWKNGKTWLVGELYDPKNGHDNLLTEENKPFFSLRTRLWY